MSLLHKIFNYPSLSSIYTQLEFRISSRATNNTNLFRQPISRINIEKYKNPLNRLQEKYIENFNEIDIQLNENEFKRNVMLKIS